MPRYAFRRPTLYLPRRKSNAGRMECEKCGLAVAQPPASGEVRLAQAGAAATAAAPAVHHGPQTRRWTEQRWLLDNIIQANGIDWDQPRSIYWNVPCGMEA